MIANKSSIAASLCLWACIYLTILADGWSLWLCASPILSKYQILRFFVLLHFSICWTTNSHRSFISLWLLIFFAWLHKTLMVANPVFSLFTGPHGSHTESSHFCIINVKLVCCLYPIKLLPRPWDKHIKHVCIMWGENNQP
jgi:hypothetical protein